MSHTKYAALASLAVIALLAACAPRTAVTTWGYSSWFARMGPSEKGPFEEARTSCLQKLAIQSPQSVAPGSAAESSFIECMNAKQWCTNAFACQDPGA